MKLKLLAWLPGPGWAHSHVANLSLAPVAALVGEKRKEKRGKKNLWASKVCLRVLQREQNQNAVMETHELFMSIAFCGYGD